MCDTPTTWSKTDMSCPNQAHTNQNEVRIETKQAIKKAAQMRGWAPVLLFDSGPYCYFSNPTSPSPPPFLFLSRPSASSHLRLLAPFPSHSAAVLNSYACVIRLRMSFVRPFPLPPI